MLTNKKNIQERDLYNYINIQMMRYWIDCQLKQPNLFESHAELEITRTEIEAAIRSLKTGKAPGTDNIPVELLKTKTKKKKNTSYTS